jgi:hypothetical protein
LNVAAACSPVAASMLVQLRLRLRLRLRSTGRSYIIARLKSLIPEPPIQPPPRTSSPPGASPPRPDRRLASSLPLGCVAAWPHRLPPPPRRLASSPPRRLANCMER